MGTCNHGTQSSVRCVKDTESERAGLGPALYLAADGCGAVFGRS
jgi:hypothetical protein